MARPVRIELAGGWYHLTARGNERKVIWRDDRDRRRFVELLQQWGKRFAVRVHAYVLMDNHYHLLVQTPKPNLSQAMQWLAVSYTVWFNRRHQRAGHLFQGRFKAILLEPQSAMEISRYLHLNPVRVRRLGLDKTAQRRSRTGMLAKPDAAVVRERLQRLKRYPSGSYRAYVGWTTTPSWLHARDVLEQGGERSWAERRQRYRGYVEGVLREGLAQSPWERLQAQMLLGSTEFVSRMKGLAQGNVREQPMLKRMGPDVGWSEIVAALERLKGEPWAAFRDRRGDWGRDVALYLGRMRTGMRLRELAEAAGGIDYGSAQTAVHRLRRRLEHDRDLRDRISKLEAKLFDNET